MYEYFFKYNRYSQSKNTILKENNLTLYFNNLLTQKIYKISTSSLIYHHQMINYNLGLFLVMKET